MHKHVPHCNKQILRQEMLNNCIVSQKTTTIFIDKFAYIITMFLVNCLSRFLRYKLKCCGIVVYHSEHLTRGQNINVNNEVHNIDRDV